MADIDGKKKILIVDDEKDLLRVMQRRLVDAGYEVLTASGGREALALLDKEAPSLVLLDIMMPQMDGFEVCRRIKEAHYSSYLPIVFFTAKDSVEDKVEGLKMGISDYITKPVDHRELLARIDMLLTAHQQYKDLSTKDELTGLVNYNFFQRQFGYYFDLAKRYKRAFSILVIDVDNFKRINDTLGHICGNFILKEISDRLIETLRKADIVARYGGDEFAVILPETNNDQALILLQRLRGEIGDASYRYEENNISVSVSFGLSTFSSGLATKEAFFDLADKDMYKDKARKKDSARAAGGVKDGAYPNEA